MKVQNVNEVFTLSMTWHELANTAFDVLNALQATIETHWAPDPEFWQHHEKERLNRLKVMFYALGKPEIYDNIFVDADNVFNNYKNRNNG